MIAIMSSALKILYSLSFNLISVPPYLLTSTRSPFLTSNGTFFPLSSVLPVPRAMTMPSVGFSLAESGMMMPPFLTSFSSAGSTRIRSPRGLTLMLITSCFFFCLYCFYSLRNQNPAAPATGKSHLLIFQRRQSAGQSCKTWNFFHGHCCLAKCSFHFFRQSGQIPIFKINQSFQSNHRIKLFAVNCLRRAEHFRQRHPAF